jgi:hypothetical protein
MTRCTRRTRCQRDRGTTLNISAHRNTELGSSYYLALRYLVHVSYIRPETSRQEGPSPITHPCYHQAIPHGKSRTITIRLRGPTLVQMVQLSAGTGRLNGSALTTPTSMAHVVQMKIKGASTAICVKVGPQIGFLLLEVHTATQYVAFGARDKPRVAHSQIHVKDILNG